MRPSLLAASSSMVLLLLASGCGKARSNPPGNEEPSQMLSDGGCYPLGHARVAIWKAPGG